jgi:hypothetical protein
MTSENPIEYKKDRLLLLHAVEERAMTGRCE